MEFYADGVNRIEITSAVADLKDRRDLLRAVEELDRVVFRSEKGFLEIIFGSHYALPGFHRAPDPLGPYHPSNHYNDFVAVFLSKLRIQPQKFALVCAVALLEQIQSG